MLYSPVSENGGEKWREKEDNEGKTEEDKKCSVVTAEGVNISQENAEHAILVKANSSTQLG